MATKPQAAAAANPFGDMVFTSEDSGSFLNEGTHEVTISDVLASTPKSPKYKDPHKQIQVVFKDSNGKQISEWYNVVGYKRYDELSASDKKSGRFINVGGYAVDNTTKLRIVDAERSESAKKIFGTLGMHCGIEKGASFQPTDLVGMSTTIVVEQVLNEETNKSQARVVRTIGEEVAADNDSNF